jgi:hypothetical protein
MIILAVFALVALLALAIFAVRRALPMLCASLAGWLAWSLTQDIAATGVSAVAAYLVAGWMLDALANGQGARRWSVGAEIAGAAAMAGGLAFLITNSAGSPSLWIVAGSAIAAMAIVARWRRLAL